MKMYFIWLLKISRKINEKNLEEISEKVKKKKEEIEEINKSEEEKRNKFKYRSIKSKYK